MLDEGGTNKGVLLNGALNVIHEALIIITPSHIPLPTLMNTFILHCFMTLNMGSHLRATNTHALLEVVCEHSLLSFIIIYNLCYMNGD